MNETHRRIKKEVIIFNKTSNVLAEQSNLKEISQLRIPRDQ